MATVSISYAASAAVFASTDLDGLNDAGSFHGMESNVIDNTSNLYDDALVAGQFKVGGAPISLGLILVFVGSILEDTPTYPDVFDGTKSTEDIDNFRIRDAVLRVGATLRAGSTAGRVYPFAPFSVAALFGGVMPKKWFVFVSNVTGSNLDNSGGLGGQVWFTGVKYEVA